MPITYTWEVTGMKTKNVANTDGVVFQTYWRKIGVDEDGNMGSFNGATPFNVSSLDPNFIPLDELKESDVLAWIQKVIDEPYENHIHRVIQTQIDEKKRPANELSADSLPWANN